MLNDVFIEKLVKKKRTGQDLALIVLISFGALIAALLAFVFLAGRLGAFGVLIIFGVFYGGWYLITNLNIEYEYSLTNGELDVDMIIAERRRKRLLTVHCKEFEILAPVNDNHKKEMEDTGINYKVYACSSMEANRLYFCIFNLSGKGKTLLIFEPDNRMLDSFKTIIPRKVLSE